MVSVNDLIKDWRGELYMDGTDCSVQLHKLARTAWHPVSEPPNKEDGDFFGDVLVLAYDETDGWSLGIAEWSELSWGNMRPDYWARIRDVVLMPPEE